MRAQGRLFAGLTIERDWRPAEPPSLAAHPRVFLDTETTGLRWWGGDLPIGISVCAPGLPARYLPFRHAGGNLDEERVRDWARHELAGKKVGFFNAPFDVNMLHAWGVDLEALGCRVFDVGNQAALLDDSRRDCSLDAIARARLGRGKVQGLSRGHLVEYHAADVENYACTDVELTRDLDENHAPDIADQGLENVLALEDELLYVTCGMMREGAPIDEEKLALWTRRSEQDMVACLWAIYRETGVRVDVGSRVDALRLFEKLGVEPPTWTEDEAEVLKVVPGKMTFVKAKLRHYQQPALRQLYRARCLASLRAKYLLKYQRELRLNGVLRYSLHQLRVDNEGGTISGRYSSSGFGTEEDDGINIQQVAGKKQLNSMKGEEDLAGYAIRELFVPAPGQQWLSADAEQIEFRLFAHYSRSRRLLSEYEKNPRTDYHNVVWAMLRQSRADITRELTKDCNFAAIFGANWKRWALMMDIPRPEARKIYSFYHDAFPEAKALLEYAMRKGSERGYIKTILGRRRRFPIGSNPMDAISGAIQGSAADENKTKLKMLHERRRETGFRMRFTVHDEVNGDVPDRAARDRVDAILNTQVLPTTVPLLWKVGIGPNWRECR